MDDLSARMERDNAVGDRSSTVPPADVDLSRVWVGVAAEVWRRRIGSAERCIGRLLRSPGLARALLNTPSLFLPWFIATCAVLGIGALATNTAGEPLVALFAPAIAAAGIAYSYGPGVDLAWELSRSMAVSDRMVLLVRALGVFAVDAALGLVASAATGAAVGIEFEWLLPMAAMSLLALAAATTTRSANVGVASGLSAWCITILAGKAESGGFTFAVMDRSLLPIYLACAVLSGAVVLFTTRSPMTMSRTLRGTV
jgi:hypothetical protein